MLARGVRGFPGAGAGNFFFYINRSKYIISFLSERNGGHCVSDLKGKRGRQVKGRSVTKKGSLSTGRFKMGVF